MLKKLCTFIGTLVLIAGIAVGGYFLYTNVLKDKINPPAKGEFEINYVYETLTDLDSDKIKHGFVKGYKGEAPEDVVIAKSFDNNGTTRSVSGIKNRAFKNAKSMKTIDIPSTVAMFGSNIFEGCDGLTTVVIRLQRGMVAAVSFYGAFDGLNLEKVTFKVSHEDVKENILSAYPKANVVVDEALVEA